MKNRVRVFVLAMALVMSTVISSNTEAGEKELFIGVSYYGLADEFQGQLRDVMEARHRARNLDGKVKLLTLDAQFDANKQNDQVNNLISQQVDAIIIVPFDREQQVPAIDASVDAGIPIIEMCASTVSPRRTSYVGSEDIVSGRLLAQELIRLAGGKGNIVVLHGVAGQNAEVMRHLGLEDVLKGFPEVKIVAEKVCDWDRAKALMAIENVIQSGIEFNILYSENDEMALGGLVALENSGKRAGIFIGGVDAIPDGLEAIRDGRLDCTVFQNSIAQASNALDVAIEAAEGKKVEPMYDIPYELVTPANLSQYLK
jgi:ABC-type sugar transport system, periplasmic component